MAIWKKQDKGNRGGGKKEAIGVLRLVFIYRKWNGKKGITILLHCIRSQPSTTKQIWAARAISSLPTKVAHLPPALSSLSLLVWCPSIYIIIIYHVSFHQIHWFSSSVPQYMSFFPTQPCKLERSIFCRLLSFAILLGVPSLGEINASPSAGKTFHSLLLYPVVYSPSRFLFYCVWFPKS